MYISHEHKFIFLRFPRVASTTLVEHFALLDSGSGVRIKAGMGYRGNGHIVPADVMKLFPDEWGKYFKIVFVRNPWDMYVSLYHHLRRRFGVRRFDEFVLFARSGTGGLYKYDDYVFDRHSGELLVDFVGRFESLNEDFKKVQAILKTPEFSISTHKHKTPNRKDYRDYYTSQWMIERIREFYDAELIAKLGYEFI